MSSLPDNDNHSNSLDDQQSFAEKGQQAEKKSASQQLVEIAHEVYDFGVDTDGKAFGFRKGSHVVRQLLNGRFSLRKELGGLYCQLSGRPASQNALTEAMAVLEYFAELQGEPVDLALRAARPNDDVIYIDMGDKAERVLKITAAGWEVLDGNAEIPVLFRRTNLTAALPTPEAGGDLEQLWQFVNMKSEEDRQVLRSWLVSAYALVDRPCPILALLGEQGTAKTSSARRVFALVDPSTAPVRRPPNDIDRLLHAVHSSRGTVFDNLSSIPRWLSDGLCRCVTGESDVDRSLFTDADVRVIQVQGVLGFTGIDVGSLAGDLAERCVWGDLEVISAAERRSERELNAAWATAYPSMLGGLLDLVVATLQKLPDVNLAEKPRMADFAEILAALDLASGSSALEHYTLSQGAIAEDIVDTDKFLQAVSAKVTSRWEGTGKELYAMLPRPESDKYWPEQRGVSGKLRRSAPDLRKSGWEIEEIKADPKSKRPKKWILVPPGIQITDAEIATVHAALKMRELDVEAWSARLSADGATAACIDSHISTNRSGAACINCRSAGCTAAEWKREYQQLALSSNAIDQRAWDELARLRLTAPEFDVLVASRPAVK